MSVQWFLHLQLNGWFVYAFLGLLLGYMETKGNLININSKTLFALHLSLFLTYALSVAWSTPITGLLYLNGLGVILQVIAYFIILKPIIRHLYNVYTFPKNWINSLLWIGIISLLAKALIQATLILPDVANIAYTIRNYVIGFVHLVMLGAITFGLGALALKNNWLSNSSLSKTAWTFLSFGFISSELLLLGQGTLLWAKLGFIPHYHLLIFISSIFFPVGLSLLLIAQWTSYPHFLKSPNSIYNQQSQHKSKNTETMKSTVLMSAGILIMLLMASCGGGSSENQGSYTPPSAQKEKIADPKGIGEIKEVNLGEDIDQALAEKGKAILDMKCTACHQFDGKRVVGPGFEGVTNRRRPEWIMNMITNVDVMLDEDPVAQKLLEECLTRMPNQNISLDESRQILEYFRKNDRERTGSSDAALN